MIFLLKQWKVILTLALVAALGLAGLTLYNKGKAVASLEFQLKQSEATAQFWKDSLILTTEALARHGERAKADAAKINTLSNRINSLHEYADLLGQPDTEGVTGDNSCLDSTDVERLRTLWD